MVGLLSSGVAHADAPSGGILIVEVRDATTLRPQADANVSIDGQAGTTDARGRVQFVAPAGRACASVNTDASYGQACAEVVAGTTTLIAVALAVGATTEVDPDPVYTKLLRFDAEDALMRADHVEAALLDARVDPTRLVTTYDGMRRLPGAPAVPRRFIEGQQTAAASAAPGGAGDLTALAPRTGSNEMRESMRLQVGRDAAADGAFSGWLKKDHAWWSAAGAIDRTDATWRGGAQLRFDVAGNDKASSLTLLALGGGADEPSSQTANWRTAWQYNDGRSTIETGVSLDRVGAMAGTTNRNAASVGWRRYFRGFGGHSATLHAEGGLGTQATIDHRDGRVALGDAWSIWPELMLTAGVGVERRELGMAQATVWTPGATLAWDPTKEGRALVAVSAAQVSLLDVGALGAWITAPRSEERAMARASWSPTDRVVLDARYIAARDDHDATWQGVDGSIGWRGRTARLGLTGATHTRALLGQGEVTHNLGRGKQLVLLGRGGVRDGAAVWGSGIGLATKLGPYGMQLTAEAMGQGDDVEARLVASLAR